MKMPSLFFRVITSVFAFFCVFMIVLMPLSGANASQVITFNVEINPSEEDMALDGNIDSMDMDSMDMDSMDNGVTIRLGSRCIAVLPGNGDFFGKWDRKGSQRPRCEPRKFFSVPNRSRV